jgi:hypothetical protein
MFGSDPRQADNAAAVRVGNSTGWSPRSVQSKAVTPRWVTNGDAFM